MSLPRWRILRASADFSAVRASGQAKPGRYLLLTAVPGPDPALPSKFGFVTPKYVGKAHDRNLVRRRLRAIAGQHANGWKPGMHVVVLALRRAKEADFGQMEGEFLRLARKAGLPDQARATPPPPGGSPC
jgi:ribonuclease P protein component